MKSRLEPSGLRTDIPDSPPQSLVHDSGRVRRLHQFFHKLPRDFRGNSEVPVCQRAALLQNGFQLM